LIVRPLLDCTRGEIEAFLAESGLRGRLDATNLSADYLRNRMRRQILPALRREWGESLQSQLCALAAAAQRFRAQAERLCAPCRRLGRVSEEGVEMDVRALSPLRDSLFPELLRGWLEEAGIWSRTLGRGDYARLARLLAPEISEGAAELPGGLTARRYRETLLVRGPQEEFPVTALSKTGPTDLGRWGRMEAERIAGGLKLLARRASALEEFMDADCVSGKLEIRAPRPGDRMRPLGAPGSRKLQDILTDLHIPAWRRRRLPVLTAGGEPIWIVGVRIAEEVRLTERTTRALHLRFIAPEPAR
jgi:tRNA(Ile)-lysidine synthase